MPNSGRELSRALRRNDTPESRIERATRNPALITRALAKGVREALERHKRLGQPVVVFRGGRAVWIDPKKIDLPGRHPSKTPPRS